ncbi:MAG: TIGR01212 family radical SAM protein [Candidatus Omnitrophica bacterium]|nr:TIGR01212 family radical SAM protein [Candidatus Omnitrophota bacterium]
MNEPYYSFNKYLREKFGERVHRISIDAGFACPNIDGRLSKEGCIYCNNKGFSLFTGKTKDIRSQIEESIKYYRQKSGVNKFLAYFQAFSNTYASPEELKEKYDVIKDFPEIVGLFISTRPDCIDEEKLKIIAQYQKDYLVWIEYGLQSANNSVLEKLNRNHTYEDFLKAVNLTRKYDINIGIHLILGLPWVNHENAIKEAKLLSKLDIQGIKFHLLHIFKETKLHEMHKEGKITLMPEKDYIKLVCDFLEYIPENIVVLRLISSSDPKMLVAPLWMNNKTSIIAAIKEEFARRKTWQGCRVKK